MDVSEAKHLRALEDENSRLRSFSPKPCSTRQRFASFCKKEGRPAAKRQGGAQLWAVKSLSERRACILVDAYRTIIIPTSFTS
jgi:hypothetical protein